MAHWLETAPVQVLLSAWTGAARIAPVIRTTIAAMKEAKMGNFAGILFEVRCKCTSAGLEVGLAFPDSSGIECSKT
jgi:hypothetical protein